MAGCYVLAEKEAPIGEALATTLSSNVYHRCLFGILRDLGAADHTIKGLLRYGELNEPTGVPGRVRILLTLCHYNDSLLARIIEEFSRRCIEVLRGEGAEPVLRPLGGARG